MFKLSNSVFLNVNFLQKSISVCTVKKFSYKYIYTGTADIQKFPFELYVATDEYSIIDIKQEYEDMLTNNITLENCIEILMCSNQTNVE